MLLATGIGYNWVFYVRLMENDIEPSAHRMFAYPRQIASRVWYSLNGC